MNEKQIKLVVFDLDGTLVDAYKAVASSLNYSLSQMGYAPVEDDRIKRAVGRGDRNLVKTFIPEENADEVLSIFRQHHAGALKQGTVFLPGAKQLLSDLRTRKLLLGIASNRPTRFTQIILKYLRVQKTFDHVLCADKVERRKPAGDILENFLDKYALRPDQALYVGDMTIDVETGKNAGIRTVAVTTGSNTREEIAALDPFAVIDDVSKVGPIIDKLNSIGRSPQ